MCKPFSCIQCTFQSLYFFIFPLLYSPPFPCVLNPNSIASHLSSSLRYTACSSRGWGACEGQEDGWIWSFGVGDGVKPKLHTWKATESDQTLDPHKCSHSWRLNQSPRTYVESVSNGSGVPAKQEAYKVANSALKMSKKALKKAFAFSDTTMQATAQREWQRRV